MKKPLQQASLSDTITDAFEVPKNYLHKTVEKKCKKKKKKKKTTTTIATGPFTYFSLDTILVNA